MNNEGELRLKVTVDDSELDNLEEELGEVEDAAQNAEDAISNMGDKTSDKANTSATDWKAVTDIVQGVSDKAMDATNAMIDSAMEQETAVSRAKSVWGEYADTVLTAANNTEDYMTQAQYLTTVNEIGAKAMAKGEDEATALDIAQREMAAGQKLAIATGKDQEDIMGGLNNAFMGITGNLGNYTGGLYDNAAGLEQWATDAGISNETIEAGTYSMEDQAQMIEYLSDKLGGAGEASETTAQKQEKLQANIEDIKATLGEQLLPVIQEVLDLITPIITAISNLPGPIQAVIAIIPVLVVIIGTIISVVTALTAAATALNVATLPFTLIIVAIIAVIALLVAAGVALYQNWDTIKAKAIELKDKIAEKWEEIKTKIVTTWENVKTKTTELWEGIKKSISDKIEAIKKAISDKVDAIKNKWQSFKDSIKTIIDAIKGHVDSFKSKVETVMSSVSGAIDRVKSAWDTLKETLSHPIEAVANVVRNGFRQGTSYVPSDGYIAELHRGEAVLTAQEAQEYREGYSKGGYTVNNTYNITVPRNENALGTALQLRKLTRKEELRLV